MTAAQISTDPLRAAGLPADGVTAWHRARGCDFPDLNDLDRRGVIDAVGFCFPNYFILPQYSSASSYRIRSPPSRSCR